MSSTSTLNTPGVKTAEARGVPQCPSQPALSRVFNQSVLVYQTAERIQVKVSPTLRSRKLLLYAKYTLPGVGRADEWEIILALHWGSRLKVVSRWLN